MKYNLYNKKDNIIILSFETNNSNSLRYKIDTYLVAKRYFSSKLNIDENSFEKNYLIASSTSNIQ